MPNKPAVLMAETSKDKAADTPLVQLLQKQVANAFILYSNYKHYHWQTFGPMFRDLHLMFDEFATATLATIDEFAERIRMIGPDPVFSPQQVMDTASVETSRTPKKMRDMVQEADENALIVIREMRRGAKLAEEADDPGTVDLFSRIVQIHEKHEWWLRDVLKKDDGFIGAH
jgi:starvation-inducible DNA-binding protein